MEKTLLLNATYEPLRIISWEKAVYLFYLGKVEIVESYDRQIGTVSVFLKVPAVVRIKRFVSLHRIHRNVKFSRRNVFTRDRYTCQYCGESFKEEHLTFDHVIPASKGGEKTFENVVTACKKCNYKKANKTPSQANMLLKKTVIQRPHWPLAVTLLSGLPDSPPLVWEPYLFCKNKLSEGIS